MTIDDVHKVNRLYDEADQVWYDMYEAPGIEGRPITATVPREDQEPSAVRRALLRRGAKLPPAVEHRETLTAAIAAEAPVVHRAGRTGWRDGHRVFVSHSHVAGEPETNTLISPEVKTAGLTGQLRRRGDLKGWQDLVAIAEHSTAMMVGLCATFAAPLLAVVRRPSFALVLVGPSRCGKSTAQIVGASALGFGTEEELPSLNATHPGLLAAAMAFNDHLLPINEVGTARGAKRDVYLALREATYALMNGQDVIRHPTWMGGGAQSTFQVLPLLSSEHSPDVWAARNGETRDEGETARLIGVPVLAPGHRTIFDLPPPELSEDALTAWETKQFRRLREGLPHQCGVAFPAYLDALVRNQRALGERARYWVSYFEEKVGEPNMSAVARDIVAKFGVLLAGGVIAAEANILPLDRKELANAVRRACQAALAELPDPEAELRADLRLLKERLAGGAIINLDACTRQELRLMRNADGFQQRKGEGEEFVVRAQVFTGWFGTPLQARRMLEWLDDEGFLHHSRSRTRGRSNEWAQKQVLWPDGTRQRSISLYLPAGLADLEHDS